MFGLGEPTPTPWDLRFTIFRFPVRVHPLFWLAILLLGARNRDAWGAVIWVGVCFVSILIHELGHAFAHRYYGRSSHIVLYSFGGLCIADSDLNRWSNSRRGEHPYAQIQISAAGPIAGFLFAGVVLGLLHIYAAYHEVYYPVTFQVGWPYLLWWDFNPQIFGIMSFHWRQLIHELLAVNIYWGLMNLLPVWPLDGGQIARQVFVLNDQYDSYQKTFKLSVATGVLVAIWAMILNDAYLVVMFGILAFQNFQLSQSAGQWEDRPW